MLKTKTITLPHLELLVVELPEGAIDPTVTMGYITARVPNHTDCLHDDWVKKLDVEGEWKHLGAVSDVADVDKLDIVEPSVEGGDYFKDYVDDCYEYATANEAFDSLLEANGWDGDISRTHLFIKQK